MISRMEQSKIIDSILKEAEASPWYEKEVRNPITGNMVKVKSLNLKDQEKYRPKELEPERKRLLKKIKDNYVPEEHGGPHDHVDTVYNNDHVKKHLQKHEITNELHKVFESGANPDW